MKDHSTFKIIGLIAWASVIFLLVPLLVILGVSVSDTPYLAFPPRGFSLRWYSTFFGDRTYIEATILSTQLAALAVIVALIVGIPAAYILTRRRFMGRAALSNLFLSPFILPLVVLGAASLHTASFLGIARTFLPLALAHAVIVLPYVIRTVTASLVNLGPALEEASLDLGAGRLGTFFRIVVPNIKAGIIAGAIFGYVTSWINVELSMFLTTASLMPLPVKMFNYVQYTVDPMIAAASGVTILLAIAIVIVIDMLVGIEKTTSV